MYVTIPGAPCRRFSYFRIHDSLRPPEKNISPPISPTMPFETYLTVPVPIQIKYIQCSTSQLLNGQYQYPPSQSPKLAHRAQTNPPIPNPASAAQTSTPHPPLPPLQNPTQNSQPSFTPISHTSTAPLSPPMSPRSKIQSLPSLPTRILSRRMPSKALSSASSQPRP